MEESGSVPRTSSGVMGNHCPRRKRTSSCRITFGFPPRQSPRTMSGVSERDLPELLPRLVDREIGEMRFHEGKEIFHERADPFGCDSILPAERLAEATVEIRRSD